MHAMTAGGKLNQLNPDAEEFRPKEKLKPSAQTSFSVPTPPAYSHSYSTQPSFPPPPPLPPVYIPTRPCHFPQAKYRILPPSPSTKRNVFFRHGVSNTFPKPAALDTDNRPVFTNEEEQKRRRRAIRGRLFPSPVEEENSYALRMGSSWNNNGGGRSGGTIAKGLREDPSQQSGHRKWMRRSDRYPIGWERSTVMVRNIPNRLRGELLELVDNHCREVNKEAVKDRSEFDFLYLPIDFSRGLNVGYAFINFTTNHAAFKFSRSWTGRNWKECGYHSNKMCKITCAHIQGKEKLRKRFQQCLFKCDSDEFLPLEFSPPRDGLCTTKVITVGRCLLGKASSPLPAQTT